MKLLAEGRESQIYDLGDGRVLRRYKRGGDPEHEARVMEHARTHGLPVPRVHAVRGDGIVLERVSGASMAANLKRRPWSAAGHARTLADLHERLHAIPAPADLAPIGEGGALLHLDLHPENVLLTELGPVVVDWTNARAGDAAFDVAYTWVILATSNVSPPLRPLRAAFVGAFLARFARTELERHLRPACDRRARDANVTAAEQDAIRRLAATVSV